MFFGSSGISGIGNKISFSDTSITRFTKLMKVSNVFGSFMGLADQLVVIFEKLTLHLGSPSFVSATSNSEPELKSSAATVLLLI